MANFLEKRGSETYIRYTVPRGLTASCGVQQLRCKLPDVIGVKESKRIARRVCDSLTDKLRRAKRAGVVFTNLDIKQAMTAYMVELSEDFSDRHLLQPIGPSTRDTHTEVMSDLLEQLHESVLSSRYPESTVLAVCKIMGVDAASVESDSLEVLRACREYSLATIGVYQAHIERLDGREVFQPFVPIAPIDPAAPVAVITTPLASEVVEPFLADKEAGKPISKGSIAAYRANMSTLVEILGDVPVGSITYDDVTRLRDTLLKLPKHRSRSERYKHLSLNELLALNVPQSETLSGRAVKETINSIKSVWKWLVIRGTVTLNPFAGVITATDSKSYKPFTDAQVGEIFSSELYTGVPSPGLTSNHSHWWLLLISLHTGARPTELVQLRLDDVTEVEGVLVMRITADESKGQSVKTKAGHRIVPVHPKLLELGFADLITKSREAGEDRVLHGIHKGTKQSGGPAGFWFKRYKKLHIPELESQGKPLYSFRSTFITHALNEAKIELPYVQQMVGHERSQMGVTRVYDAGAGAKRLFEEMSKVKFQIPIIKPLKA